MTRLSQSNRLTCALTEPSRDAHAACRVMGRLLDLPHISWRTCVADQLSDRKLVAWPMWLLLGGRLAGVVPGSLLVPFADRGWPPDRFSADTAVSLGHLLACNVGTHCGWRDAEKARNVAGCPPVLGKRL
jgi:hypothetical protein